MPMKIAIILFVALIAAGALYGQWFFGGNYDYSRDMFNQHKIADAYVLFYQSKHKCPAGLEDLVVAGFLPKTGSFYREPPGFWNRQVDFSMSSYEVFPPRANDVNTIDFIGRRDQKGNWVFDPVVNAYISDKIFGNNPSPPPVEKAGKTSGSQ
jgi:hypothetical protein